MAERQYGVLGEFEHLVLLAVLRHPDGVHSVRIGRELEERANRRVSRGALYATLGRLDQKGLLSWTTEEAGPERGGHPRRRFAITKPGIRALREYRRAMDRLTEGVEIL